MDRTPPTNPIFDLVINNRPDALESFIDSHTDTVNLATKATHASPLHFACARGFDSCVSILLNAGARVNAVDVDLETPLHKACFHGFLYVVEVLLQFHADVNAVDIHGWSALHIAVARHHVPIVRFLLSRSGIKPNISNHLGTTPLMLASTNGSTHMIQLLVDSGHVKTNLSNLAGENAYDLAVLGMHANAANTLARMDPRLVRNTRLRCVAEHEPSALKPWVRALHPRPLGPLTLIESDPTGYSQVTHSYVSLDHASLIPGWEWITSWQVLQDWYSVPSSRPVSEVNLALALGAAVPGSRVRVWGRVMRKLDEGSSNDHQSTETNHAISGYVEHARSILMNAESPKSDFERYQAAIQVLLSGAQDDTDTSRVQTAKFLLAQWVQTADKLSELPTDVPLPQPWTPDQQSVQCRACAVPFSVLVRRHHCRLCGHIYCAACSSMKVDLLSYYASPPQPLSPRVRSGKVRVCEVCHGVLTRSQQQQPTSPRSNSPQFSVRSESGSLVECPKCFQSLADLPRSQDREDHLLACFTSSPKDGRVRMGGQPALTRAARQYTTGRWHHVSAVSPKPSSAAAALVDPASECLICYEAFTHGAHIIRMGCLCCFHADCANAWFNKHAEIECPMHVTVALDDS